MQGLIAFGVSTVLILSGTAFAGSSDLGVRLAACEALRGADARYTAPNTNRFYIAQRAFRAAFEQANASLAQLPAADQKIWREELRWDLIEKNSLPSQRLKLDEIKLVKRWLFSNKKGLESAAFRPLRTTIQAYLDAAETFSISNLQEQYQSYALTAYTLCSRLARTPSSADARDLGQALGWLRARGMLLAEVDRVQKALSFPNATVKVSGAFVQRIFSRQKFNNAAKQTQIHKQVQLPVGMGGASKTVQIDGSATTTGDVAISLMNNTAEAEIQLSYSGYTQSNSTSRQGKVVGTATTTGAVGATRSIYVSPTGMRYGPVHPWSNVVSTPQTISAPMRFMERIAWRRMSKPQVQAATRAESNQSAQEQISTQLTAEMDAAVTTSQAKLAKLQQAASGFSEVTAPVEREGSVPTYAGSYSTSSNLFLEAAQIQNRQFGAPTRSAPDFDLRRTGAPVDVVAAIHQSMLNNTFELLWGGKWIADDYYMELSKILQAELPLDLMVHSRAPRWSFKPRELQPLNWDLESRPGYFGLQLVLDKVRVDEVEYTGPIVSDVRFALRKDEFGQHYLEREGEVSTVWQQTPPAPVANYIDRKISALLASRLDAKGVVLPDGGVTGLIAKVQPAFVENAQGWLYIGVPISDALMDEALALEAKP